MISELHMGVVSVDFTPEDIDIFKFYIIIIDEWKPGLKKYYSPTELTSFINMITQTTKYITIVCLGLLFFFL